MNPITAPRPAPAASASGCSVTPRRSRAIHRRRDIFALSTGLLAAEAALDGLASNDLATALKPIRRRHRQLYSTAAPGSTRSCAGSSPHQAVPSSFRETSTGYPAWFSFLSHRVHATT